MAVEKIINKEIKYMEKGPHYIGPDGRTYQTIEGLRQAEEAWKREHLQFKGKDGDFYSTWEELDEANRRYNRDILRKIIRRE